MQNVVHPFVGAPGPGLPRSEAKNLERIILYLLSLMTSIVSLTASRHLVDIISFFSFLKESSKKEKDTRFSGGTKD